MLEYRNNLLKKQYSTDNQIYEFNLFLKIYNIYEIYT